MKDREENNRKWEEQNRQFNGDCRERSGTEKKFCVTLRLSTQPKVFRYKKTGFFRKNPVFLKILHLKISGILLKTGQ